MRTYSLCWMLQGKQKIARSAAYKLPLQMSNVSRLGKRHKAGIPERRFDIIRYTVQRNIFRHKSRHQIGQQIPPCLLLLTQNTKLLYVVSAAGDDLPKSILERRNSPWGKLYLIVSTLLRGKIRLFRHCNGIRTALTDNVLSVFLPTLYASSYARSP